MVSSQRWGQRPWTQSPPTIAPRRRRTSCRSGGSHRSSTNARLARSCRKLHDDHPQKMSFSTEKQATMASASASGDAIPTSHHVRKSLFTNKTSTEHNTDPKVLSTTYGDEDITPSDTRTIQNPPDPVAKLQGPMTRACACHLNYEVSSFLGANNLSMQNGILPNNCDLLLLRNNGEDPNRLRPVLCDLQALRPVLYDLQALRPGVPALQPDLPDLRPGLKLYDQSYD